MKYLRIALLTAAACGPVDGGVDTDPNALAQGQKADDQYIVYLTPTLVPVERRAADLARTYGGDLIHVYERVLPGFAIRLQRDAAVKLARNPLVAAIELDFLVGVGNVQSSAPWGLDRADQRDLPLDGTFTSPEHGGAGAHVYVLDTGLEAEHVDFAGRVGTSRNFVSAGVFEADPDAWDDCHGHGTHVAGSAAGSRYGVAKGATVHAVRVLDCTGLGYASAIIAGLDWVAAHGERPAVANLSLGAGYSQALNDAVANATRTGVTVVVAAGNDTADACDTSPASAPQAITVGSTDRSDGVSSFSNRGVCLDLFAPGSNIVSASHSNTNGSATMSGTSMAAPHVAGAAALYLAADRTLSPAAVRDTLVERASLDRLSGVDAANGYGPSPNRLLFVGSAPAAPGGGGGTTEPPKPPADGRRVHEGSIEQGQTITFDEVDTNGGRFVGELAGPSSADFDLALERRTCALLLCFWSTVAESNASGTRESIDHEAGAGTYRWKVHAYAGRGDFRLTVEQPD
ncbi:MAG: S8 family serine peptidase [Deltaproteobacteria bacterium]